MLTFKRFLTAVVAIAILVAVAMPVQAYTVQKVYLRFSGTAGEALSTGQAVSIKDADGLVYKADAATAALRPAIGVVGAKAAAASGDAVEVVVIGIFSGWTTLSEGANGYLSETPGAITQSAPTYSQVIGSAISTTQYLVNCRNYFDTSTLTSLGTLTGATPIILEGASADAYETSIALEDPTADNTVTVPNYSGAIPLVVAQGYTQTSNGDASAADVTGSAITLADGWFTEGKTIKYTLGGVVTGANDTISVGLYFEDALVMTLTTADGAAGDWTAEFTIIATAAATQRIIGVLRAEAGAEVITDYATDTTNTATAGTIPIKCQIVLADGADLITNEYVRVEAWSKAD